MRQFPDLVHVGLEFLLQTHYKQYYQDFFFKLHILSILQILSNTILELHKKFRFFGNSCFDGVQCVIQYGDHIFTYVSGNH